MPEDSIYLFDLVAREQWLALDDGDRARFNQAASDMQGCDLFLMLYQHAIYMASRMRRPGSSQQIPIVKEEPPKK